MSNRLEPGHYEVGRVHTADHIGENGTYGVIRGENANQNRHLEWGVFCEGALHERTWFAYRHGPIRDSNGRGNEVELLQGFETKTDAVNYLKNRVDFDEAY